MKRCFLILVVCYIVLLGFNSKAMALAHIDIGVHDANDMISSDNNLIIVDVREHSEYCGEMGHIPGAYNYPWNSGVFQESYEDLLQDAKILVVCRSGRRSNSAANFLGSKGYLYVYDILGGTIAWKNTYGYNTVGCVDSDEDGFNDDLDNCPNVYNPFQADADNDQIGSLCDNDCSNLDGLNPVNFFDFAILASNWQLFGLYLVADLNSDEVVDIDDLRMFAHYWLSKCYK